MAKGTGGRPLQGDEAKRVPLSFRTTPGLRDNLDKRAAESGRSLAQEVEHRLQQSFSTDRIFHNAATLRVLLLLVNAIQTAETRSMRSVSDKPKSWVEDAPTGAAAVAACERILSAFAPGIGKTDEEKKAAQWGRDLAGMMVDNQERAKAERLRQGDDQA